MTKNKRANLKLSEGDFQRQIIEYAHIRRWKVAHFRSVKVQRKDGTTYYQTPVQADGEGWPDLFLVRGFQAIAIEVKSEQGKLSQLQEEWLDSLARARIPSYCIRPSDWGKVEQILE